MEVYPARAEVIIFKKHLPMRQVLYYEARRIFENMQSVYFISLTGIKLSI